MTRTLFLHSAFKSKRAVVAVLILGLAWPATAQGPALTMLDQIESGRWQLRSRSGGQGAENICLQNGRRLIQLRHPIANCERLVVSDSADEVTVQYICPGRGYGRTHIRRETDRLVQIDSQGIVDGLPFEFVAEGRRIGTCGS